jgi:hypothetical protein
LNLCFVIRKSTQPTSGERPCRDVTVVHIDKNLGAKEVVLVDGVLEDAIHHVLECGGRISQTEEHNVWHEDAKLRLKGGLVAVLFPNTDIIVSLAYVELGKNAGVSDTSNGGRDKQHWVEVSLRQCVRFSVILDWPVRAILFPQIKEGGGDVSLIWVHMFDVSPSQHVVEPATEVGPFSRSGGIDLAVEGFWRARFEVDGVVPGSCGRELARFLFAEDPCVLLVFGGYFYWLRVLSCFCGEVGGYPSSVGTLLLELLEDCQFVNVG